MIAHAPPVLGPILIAVAILGAMWIRRALVRGEFGMLLPFGGFWALYREKSPTAFLTGIVVNGLTSAAAFVWGVAIVSGMALRHL